jgi:hypothetical protein
MDHPRISITYRLTDPPCVSSISTPTAPPLKQPLQRKRKEQEKYWSCLRSSCVCKMDRWLHRVATPANGILRTFSPRGFTGSLGVLKSQFAVIMVTVTSYTLTRENRVSQRRGVREETGRAKVHQTNARFYSRWFVPHKPQARCN